METAQLAERVVIDGRLHLPDVTLVCVDSAYPELALNAIERSMALVDFGAAVFITRPDHGLPRCPAGLRIVTVDTIRSVPDYSRFMLRELSPYVSTSHCLVIQWDGFVLDPSMWSDEFLRFDYIGPLWDRFRDDERCICTGGFTLRSRRLLRALLDERIEPHKPEDVCIAVEYREYLERRHGIRYADKESAHRFAIEDLYVLPSAFGFHGVHNLLCVLSPEEFEEFMVNAPGAVFASWRMRKFIKHALMQQEFDLAHRALLRRRSSRGLDASDMRLWLRLCGALCLVKARASYSTK
jgi:hypothetical protein